MCIILIGKIGNVLHEAAKQQNRDGFSLFTKELGLVKAPTQEQVDQAMNQFGIWHYRIRSSGAIDEKNIHPFKVSGGTYLLYHNGVIGSGTAKLSDTACLAKTLYLSPVKTVMTVLESLSQSNRFCLVSAKNPHEFYLYGKWECEAGVLMSHKMYYGASAYKYDLLSDSQKAGWTSYARSYPTYSKKTRSSQLSVLDDEEAK